MGISTELLIVALLLQEHHLYIIQFISKIINIKIPPYTLTRTGAGRHWAYLTQNSLTSATATSRHERHSSRQAQRQQPGEDTDAAGVPVVARPGGLGRLVGVRRGGLGRALVAALAGILALVLRLVAGGLGRGRLARGLAGRMAGGLGARRAARLAERRTGGLAREVAGGRSGRIDEFVPMVR